jgi:hypothetical protein
MDLAEIPTFEMLQQWGPDADPQKEGDRADARMGSQTGVAENGKLCRFV